MKFEDPSFLNRYLVKNLEPLTGADPVILAQYVAALLKKDTPIKELENLCAENLVEFLGQGTKSFVTNLFQALKDGSIVAHAESLNAVQKVESSSPLITKDPIEMEISSSKPRGVSLTGRENGLEEKEASDEDDDGDRNHKHRRQESQPPSFDNNGQGQSLRRPNRKRSKPFENGQMFQERYPQSSEKWKRYNSASFETSLFDKRHPGWPPLPLAPLDIGLWTRVNPTFHGNPGSRVDLSVPLGHLHSIGRERGISSGPCSQHDPKLRIGHPLDFALQMASAGSSPSLFAGRGMQTFGLIPAMPNGGLDALNPLGLRGKLGPTSNQSFGIGMPRQRCRDFEERGFCLRGDVCPMEHGVNRIVVDDVQSLSQFNLPVSLPSGHLSGVTEETGPLASASAPSSFLMNNKLHCKNSNPEMTGDGLGLSEVLSASTAAGEADFYDPDQPLWINERPETYNALSSHNVDCAEPLWKTDPSDLHHCKLSDGIAYGGTSKGIASVVGPQISSSSVWGRIGNSGNKLDKTSNFGSTITSIMSSARNKAEEDQEGILSTIAGTTHQKKQTISEDVVLNAINLSASPRLHSDPMQNIRRPYQKALRTVYVSCIPLESNKREALLTHFHKFGVVISIYIPKNSKRAFVQFSTREEAEAALKAPDAVMGNRFIKLSWANRDRIPDNGTDICNTATTPQGRADTPVPPQPSFTDKIKKNLPASDVPISSAVQPRPLVINSLNATFSSVQKIESVEILKEEIRLKQELLDKKRNDFRLQLDRLEKQVLAFKGKATAGEAVKRRKVVKVSNAITPKPTDLATAGYRQVAEDTQDKSNSVENVVSPSSKTKSTTVLQSPRRLKQPSKSAALLLANRFKLDKHPTTFRILPPLPADFANVGVLSEHFSSFGDLSAVELEDPETLASPACSEPSGNFGARITFTMHSSADKAFLNGKCWQGHNLQFMWLTASSNSVDDHRCRDNFTTPTSYVPSKILGEATCQCPLNLMTGC